MSHLNETGASATTQVNVENFKKVQTRLKTLVLTLQTLTNTENEHQDKKQSKTTVKRESLFRELNQMRDEVNVYVNDIQRQIINLRPRNTNDEHFQDKAHAYITLLQLTTDLLNKINQLFGDVFDQLTNYINDLWIHMNNHDQTQIRATTRRFNEFLQQKMSNSDKLFNDIQQTLDNIEDNHLFGK